MASNIESELKADIPPRHQDHQPGSEVEMTPAPIYLSQNYKAAGKLAGKVALVTGADSGIGRAVAVLFAHEGADVAIAFLDEGEDAQLVKAEVEKVGRKCLLLPGDLSQKVHAQQVVEKTVAQFGKLDILVNAAEQHVQQDILDISEEQLVATFRTNISASFFPSTMPPEQVATFGQDTSLHRAGQPFEVATCYVFLASDDSSYINGQTLHPNGGEVVNA